MTSQVIKEAMKSKSMNQRDLASQSGISYQELNMFLTGKRSIPLNKSMLLDKALRLEIGTLAREQLETEIKEQKRRMEFNKKRERLIAKIKENGGFWSYDSPPYSIDDDSAIEEALIHLPFEDMNILFDCWSCSHIKRVWKERLLPQGERLSILNFLLAVKIFNVNNPKKYIQLWQ